MKGKTGEPTRVSFAQYARHELRLFYTLLSSQVAERQH